MDKYIYELNCPYCKSDYSYVEDKEMEELGLICFDCKCDEIAVPLENPYLKEE